MEGLGSREQACMLGYWDCCDRASSATRRSRLSVGHNSLALSYSDTAGIPDGSTTHGCFDAVKM